MCPVELAGQVVSFLLTSSELLSLTVAKVLVTCLRVVGSFGPAWMEVLAPQPL